MREATIAIYSYSELSDKAKEKVKNNWREGGTYHWHEENQKSIEAFCAYFNAKLTHWEIGAYYPYSYKTNAENENFRNFSLKDFEGKKDLTGYYLDDVMKQSFIEFYKINGDVKGAFNSAIEAGFKAWRDDIEYSDSDEAIEEDIINNDLEFLADGTISKY